MPKNAHRSIDLFFGFGGMHPKENKRARYWASHFEPFMLIIACWTLLEWHLSSEGLLSSAVSIVANWSIWGFFLLETLILCYFADRPLRYLARNWSHLVIILLGIPLLYDEANRFGILRMIRLLVLVGFFTHSLQTIRLLLAQNHLGKTLLVALFIIMTSGILIATIDPNIETPLDGIWWAWVTVTTVGYGDIVPTSSEGRIFASLLILFGICLMALITANISAYLLSKGMAQELQYEKRELTKLYELESQVNRLEKKIDQLLETPQKEETPPKT